MSECLLAISAPARIEAQLVDWFVERDDVPAFTSAAVHGRGGAHQGMSLAEQVEGRSRQIQFQLQLPLEAARVIVEALRTEYAGARLHYWIVPVIEGGPI
jgi:hypothetical protein